MNRVLLLLEFIATTLVIQGDAFYQGGGPVYHGGRVYWRLGQEPRHGAFRTRPQKAKKPIQSDVRQKATPAPQCENEYDVVIVGGGCGGVYSAWRLANDAATPDRSILLIEATNRIGGRLLSETMPNVQVSEAELGGMRFIRDYHVKLAVVVNDLGLETAEFLMDEGNDKRPYAIRDTVFKQGELTTSDLPLALFDDEVGKTAEEIQYDVFEATVPSEERNKPADQMMTVYGYPLYNLGFRNAYTLANASEDAMNYFDATSGYNDYMINLNAAWLMYPRSSDFASTKFERVVDGMEQIPQGLYDEFMNDAYAASQMGKTVTEINKLDNGKYAVLYEDTKDPAVKSVVCASDVILSLTRRQLQRIKWNAFKESAKAPLLDSVYSEIAFKLFLSFDSPPFWKDSEFAEFNLNQGRTLSSLPSRNTYYYTGEGEDDSMIMMYGDGANAQFWADLAVDGIPTMSGPEVFFPTTEPMVAQALRQLAINHNTTVDKIGTPKQAMFQLWSADKPIRVNSNAPAKYSIYYPSEPWHVWRAGYNFTDIWDDIIQLDPNQNVYLVGEAYSLNQGWIEGALDTADEMLSNAFDIPPIESEGRRRKRNPRNVH